VQHHFEITNEEILKEHGKIYEILVITPKKEMSLTAKELLFGPYLLSKKCPVFQEKWQRELLERQRVLTQLNAAKIKNDEKLTRLMQEIQWIKEVLDEA
jgi:tRNA (adenine22-N1)-methyltransferase